VEQAIVFVACWSAAVISPLWNTEGFAKVRHRPDPLTANLSVAFVAAADA
jgi:hypothetical protein